MEDICEGSSSFSSKIMNEKPVIVRVKRKSSQSRLDAFWLEINERPLKKPLLDFGKLSISDSTGKEELKTKKVFVQHLDTVTSSEATIDILQSFVPNASDASELRTKLEERRHTFKQDNKQNQLLSKARQKHEVLSKNARFEQIWKRRKGRKDTMPDDSLNEICHLYDVVCVDVEEEISSEVEEQKCSETSLEDNAILLNYLPLLREFVPSAAAEIESDISAYKSEQDLKDDYVYDLYMMKDGLSYEECDSNSYPLVQVDDEDDFYGGPIQSEFESDDSNAEDNPLNDYPDEETSEDEPQISSHDESQENGRAFDGDSEEVEDETYYNHSDIDSLYTEEEVCVDDGEDWRWKYR
ncbi:PREDICTED: RNA-directed DNA methylation 4 isoform X2 [Nelumbo nucifera]|nr:PREDICTED: RNA-directed DNA methylation 4 isoform X2 [Nelumbo nucifera]